MKTKTAIKLAGSSAALAALLDITPSAVSQWGETIPDLRVYQLKEKRPDWFIAPAQAKRASRKPGKPR